MKTCRKCGREELLTSFEPQRRVCKDCRVAARTDKRRAGLDPSYKPKSSTGRMPGRPRLPGTTYSRHLERIKKHHKENGVTHPHIDKPFEKRACLRCGEEKVPLDFSVDRSKPDMCSTWCKECSRLSRAEFCAKNPEKARQDSLLGQHLKREERDELFDELSALSDQKKKLGMLSVTKRRRQKELLVELRIE